jgi:hypothetical protein
MLYDAARAETSSTDNAYVAGTETAQRLFSQIKITGSFQIEAKFNEP